MSSKTPLSSRVMVTLGLTGALTSAISCGPCLKIAVPDTGEEGDTGDTGDTAEEDTPAAASREAAADRVLARGVLPEDVAALLVSRQRVCEE